MKKVSVLLAFWIMPFFAHAGCKLDVGEKDLIQIARGLQEHIKSISTIAKGYKGIDAQESMWLTSISQDVRQVQTGVLHLIDLAQIRNSVSGIENQKIVRKVQINSMAELSESASISKDYLLESSATITNQAAGSEVSQIIVILNSIILLGNSCKNES